MNEVKPLLAITMGDPAGVGPEISLQALHSKKVNQVCRPIIFGDAEILRRVGEVTNQSSDFQVLSLDTFEGLDVDKIDTPTILNLSLIHI